MNLLITGAWQEAKKYIETIEKMGHQVQFLQFEKDELPCDYEWVEGIVGNAIFLSHPIEKFNNLKYIQLTSAGFDRVPMDYVKEHGIKINNARGVYSAPMAEYAVAGVLSLYKHLRYFADSQKNHRWEKHRGLLELVDKKVCIVGCGSVGTECAKRFQAFGCHIIGVDLYPRQDDYYQTVVALKELNEVLPDSDVIILTLPLTKGTLHLMDHNHFSLLKDDAIVVNISRGAVIDTKALVSALPKLGGAVLDVFEKEPLDADSPLWGAKNVILTPHNSFIGDRSPVRLSHLIVENLSRMSE